MRFYGIGHIDPKSIHRSVKMGQTSLRLTQSILHRTTFLIFLLDINHISLICLDIIYYYYRARLLCFNYFKINVYCPLSTIYMLQKYLISWDYSLNLKFHTSSQLVYVGEFHLSYLIK